MNISLIPIFLVVFCYCLLYTTASDVDYLRTLDDFIAYRISFKPQEEELKYQEGNEEVIVPIMSADDEQYHCYLPIIEQNTKKRIETYSGPSPADLLKPLYDDSSCSYRIEPYWTYEVCHGRYILQYHENKETKLRTEYYLGNYAKIQADTEAANFDQLNPPTRKFAEAQLPYYPVTYYHGTTCDLTNKPRQTTVLYVCDENSRSHVHSLNEVSSCNYEVVIMTNRLCAHPSFQKPPQKEHDIRCFATDKNQINAKPRRLRNMEHESTSQFFQEFALHKSSSDAPRNVFTLLQTDDTNDELAQLNVILEALKAAAPKSTISLLTPKMTASEKELVEQFWSGKTCLSGGSGWWKYEICYGRSVTQYHEEAGKERTNVVLGMFHKDVHMQWAEQNPHKALKTDGERIYQVANMYSKGDLCSETGAHRSCEVRIRCQEESTSPSKVLIYLLEPETCSYILVVESPLLCDGLQKANKYGILPSMPELEEAEVLHETREISSKDHATSSIQISLRSLDELVKAKDALNAEEEGASDEGESGATTTQKKGASPRAKVDLSFGDAILNHHDAVVEIVQSIAKLKNVKKDSDDVEKEEADTMTKNVDKNESDEQKADKEEL